MSQDARTIRHAAERLVGAGRRRGSTRAAVGSACARLARRCRAARDLARLAPDRRRAAFRGPGVERRRATSASCSPCAQRLAAEPVVLAPEPLPRGQRRAPPRRRPLAAAVGGCRRLRAGGRHASWSLGADRRAGAGGADAGPRRRRRRRPRRRSCRPRCASRRRREPAVAGQRPDDSRRAARALSGGAQAVRRHLGARRAVRLPAQRHGRRRAALRRRPRRLPNAVALARSARSRLRGDRGRCRRRWPQPRSGAAAAPPSEVRAWLLRIHDAASRRNFQGTFVVSGGGGVASARIAHFCEGPNQYERIESLDGRQRKVFRHNDVVHTLWPASQRGDDRAARAS